MIILTAQQADQVRGPTTPGHSLDPVALTNGTFALPESVLTDHAHAQHHTMLELLPRREVAANEYQGGG